VQEAADPGFLERAWAWLSAFLLLSWKENTREFLYAIAGGVWALMRLAGKTVESGHIGVKFSFGRVVRTCEPGFYPLVPVFQVIRIVPSRARTLDLPRQTLATDDGLVFEVDANVVYRVTDASKALVEVRDYEAALGQVLSLSVHEVLAARDRSSLRVSALLDAALRRAMHERVAAWGITVERAGFTSIRPLQQTTRITQLRSRLRTRASVVETLASHELEPTMALGLVGSPTRMIARTRSLRVVERRSREAAELRNLTRRLDTWLASKDKALLTAERSNFLRNAREILLARR
jgi:regulator of protease activity HflC (stomatin/prohibitin superfamily)